MRVIIEGQIGQLAEEDGGQAMIARVDDPRVAEFFVQLQSWSPRRRHDLMRGLAGKRVRVTVETVE